MKWPRCFSKMMCPAACVLWGAGFGGLGPMLSDSLQAQEVRRALPAGSSPQEQARFLAGLPLSPESELAPLQAQSYYLEHRQEYGRTWERFMREHFGPKRQWALSEVATLAPARKTLYYLFSGPDLINAVALFPAAEVFILVALEPLGQVPPPESLEDAAIALGLANLRQATETTLNFSYFITQEMRSKLEQSAFRGVLPILYAFAARAGLQVDRVESVRVDEDARLRDSGVGGTLGWRLTLSEPGSLRSRTLYYFRGDLSNVGLRGGTSGLLRWLQSQPRGAAYLKAASYLLHENHFSVARDFLLNHSDVLLQDDSGIPLRFFSPEQWQLYFFGTYTRPIELFQNRLQPELQRAYATEPIRPLPFGTGYMFRPGESNLLLAVRRGLAPVLGPTPSPIYPSSPSPPSRTIPRALPVTPPQGNSVSDPAGAPPTTSSASISLPRPAPTPLATPLPLPGTPAIFTPPQ